MLRSSLWLDEPTFQGSVHTTRTHTCTYTHTHTSQSTESLKGKIKDEKSTTALASMRGEWDMKRDIFRTYLSVNRDADRPL